jgi:ATP-binding cassette subfamily F protein uup
MREQYRQRRKRTGGARLALDDGEQSGKLVFEAENVSLAFDGNTVIRDLSTTILRGDRVGIIGPNGVGKSTLIKVLLGELPPDSGRVRRGTRQQVAYFDQQRDQLNTEKSVMDNVADGSQHVQVNGRDRHVASYLRDFLFPPQRLQSPVSTLSGGERNRLLLARLFARPANLLVMDEPTNDLDVETLELLEELLIDYQGTLLLVSHDRAFLDNVVTSTLVFEGDGVIGEYVGGYTDWYTYSQSRVKKPAEKGTAASLKATSVKTDTTKPGKLSYKQQRELDALPAMIEQLENEQAALQATIGEAGFYQQPHEQVSGVLQRLQSVEDELEHCFGRWEALESGEG